MIFKGLPRYSMIIYQPLIWNGKKKYKTIFIPFFMIFQGLSNDIYLVVIEEVWIGVLVFPVFHPIELLSVWPNGNHKIAFLIAYRMVLVWNQSHENEKIDNRNIGISGFSPNEIHFCLKNRWPPDSPFNFLSNDTNFISLQKK